MRQINLVCQRCLERSAQKYVFNSDDNLESRISKLAFYMILAAMTKLSSVESTRWRLESAMQ